MIQVLMLWTSNFEVYSKDCIIASLYYKLIDFSTKTPTTVPIATTLAQRPNVAAITLSTKSFAS